MRNTESVDILAFGAHPDDVELSAGGTLIKCKQDGLRTAIVDLTGGELGTRGSVSIRKSEAKKASDLLFLDHRCHLELEDGYFEINAHSLNKVIEMIRRFTPQIVLANAPSDRHPDHGRASELVERACFLSGLPKIKTQFLGKNQAPHRPKHVFYYIQDRFIKPDFVVNITSFHEQKLKAIAAYKSQFFNPDSTEPNTPISSQSFWELLTGKAQLMGRYAGYELGEGFVTSRPLGIDSLMDID